MACKVLLLYAKFPLSFRVLGFLGEISLEKSFSLFCASAFHNFHEGIGMPPGSLAACAVGTQIIRWPVTTTTVFGHLLQNLMTAL